MTDYGPKLTSEQREELETAIRNVDEAIKGDDAEKIKSELEKVYPAMKALLDIKQAEEQAKAQAEAAPQSADDNVVDATFTEQKN